MHNKESHKTPYAIRAAAKKGRRDWAEDSQTMEEESYELQESEQQVEDKDEDDDIENSATIKATKRGGRGGKANEGTSTETPTAKGNVKGENRK